MLPGDPAQMMLGQNEDSEQLAIVKKKYGFKNKTYFKNYMFALAQVVYKLPKTLKSRAPIAMDTINTFKQLEALKY